MTYSKYAIWCAFILMVSLTLNVVTGQWYGGYQLPHGGYGRRGGYLNNYGYNGGWGNYGGYGGYGYYGRRPNYGGYYGAWGR